MIDNLKQEIIEVVAKNNNLTPIKIHNILKRKSYSKSYQNTHKTLKKMIDESIIVKINNEYKLNNEWVNSQIKKLESYTKNTTSTKKKIYNDDKLKIYRFNYLSELNNFWIEFILNQINENDTISEIFWEGPNCWWLFSDVLSEEKYLSILSNKNIEAYFLIKINNKLNEIAKKFYMNKKTFSCIVEDSNNIYVHRGIVGEHIFEIEYLPEINDKLDKIYSSNCQEVFLNEINNVVKNKTKLTLKIIKDKELARLYSKNIKSNFMSE